MQRNLHLGAHAACQELIMDAEARWKIEEGDYRDDVSAPLTVSVCVTITDLYVSAVDHGHCICVAHQRQLPQLRDGLWRLGHSVHCIYCYISVHFHMFLVALF